MEEFKYIYESIDVFFLIFCRIAGFIMILPIIEETRMPKMSTITLCTALTIPVFFKTDLTIEYYQPTLIYYAIALFREILVGLILGFIIKVFFQVYPFVGMIWSTQGGLSMSMVMDPTSGTQSSTLGKIYNLGFAVYFLISDGYHYLIKAVINTFETIPLNGAIFTTTMALGMVSTLAEYFIICVRLAAPIIAILIIVDCTLGILARTVPQMNMFVIGIPLKMIIMFILLISSSTVFRPYNDLIIDNMINTFTNLIQGLIPS